MIFNKTALIFLSCAVVFALGIPPPEYADQENARMKYDNVKGSEPMEGSKPMKASDPELFSTIRNAFKKTLEQENASLIDFGESVKAAVKDAVVARIEQFQADLDLLSIPVRVLNNMINKNQSFFNAISEPMKTASNSYKQAANSASDSMHSILNTAEKTAKATFNVAMTLPTFGLNLMGQSGQEINQALQDGYDKNIEILTNAVNGYRQIANTFNKAGYDIATRFYNSTINPRLAKLAQSRKDGTLKQKWEILESGAKNIQNYALEVARNLSEGSLFFNEAGNGLEGLLDKYSLKITEGNATIFKETFQKHVENTKESVRKAEKSLTNAFNGLLYLLDKSNVHEARLQEALNYVAQGLKYEDGKAYDIAKDLASEATNDTMQNLVEVGNLLFKAGSDLASSSMSLMSILPEFGLGLLGKRTEELGKQFADFVTKANDDLVSVIGSFFKAGKTIVNEAFEVTYAAVQPNKANPAMNDENPAIQSQPRPIGHTGY